MRLLTIAVVLLAAVPVSADLFDTMALGVYAARAGDLVATEIALQRADTHEGNPLMRNRSVRLASGAVSALAFNYGTAKIHKANPRLALWMRIGVVVGWGYVTAHNLRIGR